MTINGFIAAVELGKHGATPYGVEVPDTGAFKERVARRMRAAENQINRGAR